MRMNLEIAAINVVSEGTFHGPKGTIVFIFFKTAEIWKTYQGTCDHLLLWKVSGTG